MSPLTRRRFCAAVAAAGLGAPVALRLAAAAPPPGEHNEATFEPFVFIHAGDPELGSPDLKGTAERFALLGRRARALGAAFVLVAGDVTHDSSAEQLAAFDAALKAFAMPVKVVRGNHDTADVFRKRFGEDHYVFTYRNCDFVCLNSDLLGSSGPDASREGRAQWAWLEEALARSRREGRTHVFLMMHHPGAGGAKMSALLAKYGVKVVLCGHTHTTEERPGDGFVTYVTPGTAKFRDKGGLGYRVFRIHRDRVEQAFVPLEKEVAKVVLRESAGVEEAGPR